MTSAGQSSADGQPLYAYFGPAGTFTEAALLAHLRAADPVAAEAPERRVPYATVPTALDAVRRGEVVGAMVPLENSVEGSVPITLDELASGDPLHIEHEVVLPVSFGLLARPGTSMADIRTVAGHPHAQPQCRRWLAANLPDAEWQPAASNAEGARAVAEGRFDAALAGAFAAPLYGLTVLAEDIHDIEGAETRFVLVGPPGPSSAPTGADKTSLVLYMGEDHPGALLEILTELAVRGVNLTRIESRPTGGGIGSYCFSIDAEGHIDDARVGEALLGLRRVCQDVRFLGSYPRADGRRPLLRTGVSDPEFADARAWLQRIRDHGV
jgi:prephenate dehydratase